MSYLPPASNTRAASNRSDSVCFLNTRPDDVAAQLTESLTALGVSVKQMPLLSIERMDAKSLGAEPFVSNTALEVLTKAHGYDLFVCVSPRAAQFAVEAFVALGVGVPRHKTWLAVGQATANALACHGIEACVPDVASNEGMLAMPLVQQLTTTSRVLILRGVGGRRLLHDTLIKRGVMVDVAELYRREKPDQLMQRYDAVKNWANTVLVSSGQAWFTWLEVCCSPECYQYVVLGERLYGLVAGSGYSAVRVETLSAGDIAKALGVNSFKSNLS